MTIQISKIQLRRGPEADLPGASAFGLDVGELAFTTDTNRVFIGTDPSTSVLVNGIHGAQNYETNGFPFSNVEVLTEFSPQNQIIFDAQARNITTAFIVSQPMAITGPNSWATLSFQQISGLTGSVTSIPFVINAQNNLGNFGTAQISYYIIDFVTGMPMRTGQLKVFYQNNAFPPILIDDAVANPFSGFPTGGNPVDPNMKYGMIAFQAVPIATGISIQYQINLTGSNLPTPIMYFRVESPFVAPAGSQPTMQSSNSISTTVINIVDGGYIPYDVVGDMFDTLTAGEIFFTFIFVRAVSFPAGLPNSLAVCGLPPTNAVTLPILVNNIQVGSINFAAGSPNGTFTFPNNTTLMPGDILSLVGPNPVDLNFGQISYTISGTVVP